MNIDAAIKQLEKDLGKPRHRAKHGQWVPYAWLVRGLVEKGHEVMDSVRLVVAKSKITIPADVAEGSLRAAYYKLKNKPWPAKAVKIGDDAPEGFEV